MTPKTRGDVLATVARSVMADLGNEDRLMDPVPGQCVNGRQRSHGQAEYDWLCNNRRVECKSSQLHFMERSSVWRIQFTGVKLAFQGHRAEDAFDDLILVVYTPRRLYIYRHDLVTGLSTAGKLTPSRGHIIQIGSAKTLCWREGLKCILAKLDAGGNTCERIVDVPLDDYRISVASSRHTAHAMHGLYDRIPLASLSPVARGLVLQRLAQEVDIGSAVGWCRSDYIAPYDWIRDGVRVECKSSQLSWCARKQLWKISFYHVKIMQHIKRSSVFDELQLVIYTPAGIYIYHHDLQLGVSSAGLATQAEGCSITIHGTPKGTSWSEGLDSILSKLDRGGCRRLAHIHWD